MSLDSDNLHLAQYADQLDAALLRAIDGEPFDLDPVAKGLEDPEPAGSWGVMGALQGLLGTWVLNNVATLPTWTERILKSESWGAREDGRKVAQSAQELMTVMHDTLDNLLGMELRISAKLLRQILNTLAKCVGDYSAAITEDLHREALLPPVPPLTRYKQQFVSKHEKKERSSSTAGSGRIPITPAPVSSTTASGALSPQPQRRNPGQLALQLNSLEHLAKQLPLLNDAVGERWRIAGQLSDDTGASDKYFVDRIFQDVELTLERGKERTVEYITAQIVFVNLREDIFTRLYRWHVSEARLAPVLARMNQLLGDIVSQLESVELQRQVALQLLRDCVQSVLRVLLDGGQARVFTEDDAGMIEEDVGQHIVGMFYADGDGLDDMDIDAELAPLRDVCELMAAPSHSLIEKHSALPEPPKYDSHSQHQPTEASGMPPYPTQVPGGLTGNPDVLLRVMCHRADRLCSKLLKEVYHMHRTEESQQAGGGILFRPKLPSMFSGSAQH